jgi:hypothetical protein
VVIQDIGSSLVTPLELAGCMIHFKHRLPTTEEFTSLKRYCLTQMDTPWNPSSFSDQVAEKFYQQVIDDEQENNLNTKSDYSSYIKVDLVEQGIPKLSYFDPSDAHDTNVKVKYPNLVFQLDTIVMKNTNGINQLNKDSFYSKALPAKIEYEKLSPYFAFCPHDVIQHTLRQTTQLAKSTIHYPMRRHLKIRCQISQQNRRSLKSDVQELLRLLDTKPSLFGKIVIISIDQEILIMMCQTELDLRLITQTSILAVELDLRCIT